MSLQNGLAAVVLAPPNRLDVVVDVGAAENVAEKDTVDQRTIRRAHVLLPLKGDWLKVVAPKREPAAGNFRFD